MENKPLPGIWKAVLKDGNWQIETQDGQKIASIEKSGNEEANAKLIAISPYMLEALRGVVGLIGDEDLPDNGELSGAAVCDMARAAISLTRANC